MIIAKNVPLERQIGFLAANVRTVPCAAALERSCRNEKIAFGLITFRALLRDTYRFPLSLPGKNDDAKHDNLIATLNLRYTCFSVGTVSVGDGGTALHIDKALPLKTYKRGGVAQKAEWLTTHGLNLSWFSATGNEVDLRKASAATLTYPNDPDLIPAVKSFVEAIEATGADPKDSSARQFICNEQHLFSKADYETVFTRTGLERDELDPVREDVLATAGRYREDWISLVDLLTAELTIPARGSERAIKERANYSPRIRDLIEKLGCSNCDEDCAGERLTKVHGVDLCRKRAYNRRIYVQSTSKEELGSIQAIARLLYPS